MSLCEIAKGQSWLSSKTGETPWYCVVFSPVGNPLPGESEGFLGEGFPAVPLQIQGCILGISSNNVDVTDVTSQNSCYFSVKDGISHGNILGSTMVEVMA